MGKLGRTIKVGLLVGAALALSMAPVLAATPVSGSLSGVEDAVLPCSSSSTSCTASFAGYFSATKYPDSGFWTATVTHGPLPSPTGSPGYILGGTFALDMLSGKVVTGELASGGKIEYGTLTPFPFGFCTQTYSVTDSLNGVTDPFNTGSLAVILTHYGTLSSGSCTDIFFATVAGSLTLG